MFLSDLPSSSFFLVLGFLGFVFSFSFFHSRSCPCSRRLSRSVVVVVVVLLLCYAKAARRMGTSWTILPSSFLRARRSRARPECFAIWWAATPPTAAPSGPKATKPTTAPEAAANRCPVLREVFILFNRSSTSFCSALALMAISEGALSVGTRAFGGAGTRALDVAVFGSGATGLIKSVDAAGTRAVDVVWVVSKMSYGLVGPLETIVDVNGSIWFVVPAKPPEPVCCCSCCAGGGL